MKKILTLCISVMMAVSVIGCSNKDKVVAVVNDKEITLGNYEVVLALNKSSMDSYSGGAMDWSAKIEGDQTYGDKIREIAIESMINSEVMYQQAEKDKLLPEEKEVQEQIDGFNESIKSDENAKKEFKNMGVNDEFLKYQFTRDLASNNLQNNFKEKTKVSDKEMNEYYEKNKEDYYTDTIDVSHILISTQDSENKELTGEKLEKAKKEAQEVLDKVNAGEDFAELAKKYSADPGSAENGGELGVYGKENNLVKEFSDAAFKLKTGEVSGLVKTEFGYHIIKCNERIDKQETFEEVKDKVKTTLLNEKYAEYVEKLKKDSKIEQKEDIVKSAKF